MFSLTVHKCRLRALGYTRSDLAANFAFGAGVALNLLVRFWP